MQVFLLLLALCQHSVHSTPDSDALLDAMLQADGISLAPNVLQFRRNIFELSWLAREQGSQLSLEAMYTAQELKQQKGAVLSDTVAANEEMQKREEANLASVTTPKAYDSRLLKVPGSSEPLLNSAQNQQTCGNCYLHTFIAALELAYAKASGTKVKFSEQEMTDCYFKGCHGGDYRMVSLLMSYIDKISSRSDYGDYLDGKFTCRQETTPDSLNKIKIAGYVEVTPATVEAAIVNYGSVMVCMKWGSAKGEQCRMDNYKKGDVVSYPEVVGGCDHAILIVGYTPTYYIVRNSHGTSWGDGGYFLIQRDTNSCGIEETMAAIIVESRLSPKDLVTNKCPADKPTFCNKISTCVASGQACVEPSLIVEKREEDDDMIQGLAEEEEEGTVKRYSRSERKKRDLLEENIEKRCADLHPACPMLKDKYGCNHPATTTYCPKLCGKCGSGEKEEVAPKPTNQEQKGNCVRPAIVNGMVRNSPTMRNGEKLAVQCNGGYTLVGEPVYCLIQNVFTNKDKDARLMPECIKLGSNTLAGNGATYSGRQSTYRNAMGQSKTCDVWKKDVLEGQLMGMSDGYKYQMGNHNFCRNPTGTDPVPMCLANDGTKANLVFCFQHPGCDFCTGAKNDPSYSDEYCENAKRMGACDYADSNSVSVQTFYWEKCKATCCSISC